MQCLDALAMDEGESVKQGEKLFNFGSGFLDLPLSFCKHKFIDF